MKYLYVLSSEISDNYLEQTLLSITSLKLQMPGAFISLLIDNITHNNLTGKRSEILKSINEIKIIEIDKSFKKEARSRWLKTTMRNHIEGDFLYIDGDTIISDDLDEIFSYNINIGAVLDDHTYISEYEKYRPVYLKKIKNIYKSLKFDNVYNFKYYFNGGVFLCKDCQVGHDFFNEWHRLWLHCYKLNMLSDQPSLNQANFNLGNVISELNGKWNCQLMHDGSIKYIHNAKILHYFTTHVHEKFFLLANKEYTDKIKETGTVDQDIINNLKDAKSHFAENTRIMLVNPSYNDFYDSAICGAAKRIYHTKFGIGIEFILSFIKKYIFTPIRKRIFLRK